MLFNLNNPFDWLEASNSLPTPTPNYCEGRSWITRWSLIKKQVHILSSTEDTINNNIKGF